MNVRIAVIKTIQDGVFKGSVYIPDLDDVWSFICIIEDDIYTFSWDTNKSDPCWVCNRIVNDTCNKNAKGCPNSGIIDVLTDSFETKIIKKYKGKKN